MLGHNLLLIHYINDISVGIDVAEVVHYPPSWWPPSYFQMLCTGNSKWWIGTQWKSSFCAINTSWYMVVCTTEKLPIRKRWLVYYSWNHVTKKQLKMMLNYFFNFHFHLINYFIVQNLWNETLNIRLIGKLSHKRYSKT